MIRLLTGAILAVCLIALLMALRAETASPRPKPGKIEWLTMEQAYALHQHEPRKWLIDIYTDWCGWCKVMDRETYTDARVVEYVGQKYYAVKFNAEQRDAVQVGEQRFEFVPQGNGGVHQLALSLTNNRPSYPTTVFLDEKMEMIQPLPGYLKAKEFHEIITFFGDNYHQKEQFDQYKTGTYPKLFSK
ncbi:hypothetical protein GCM10027275_03860 [Rhabdobacter roseus]|uniref:Thioredoxin-related protein n=1 Tax=Rhabdobacter roseus TaxID=1655419 RepID=A0A840TH38_9BACT|nr:DUF255 domain-containing protein [Rhabdobacter roseus]MBB5282275.1 thioredoxin-related protein [Rhabdobacter roseus]